MPDPEGSILRQVARLGTQFAHTSTTPGAEPFSDSNTPADGSETELPSSLNPPMHRRGFHGFMARSGLTAGVVGGQIAQIKEGMDLVELGKGIYAFLWLKHFQDVVEAFLDDVKAPEVLEDESFRHEDPIYIDEDDVRWGGVADSLYLLGGDRKDSQGYLQEESFLEILSLVPELFPNEFSPGVTWTYENDAVPGRSSKRILTEQLQDATIQGRLQSFPGQLLLGIGSHGDDLMGLFKTGGEIDQLREMLRGTKRIEDIDIKKAQQLQPLLIKFAQIEAEYGANILSIIGTLYEINIAREFNNLPPMIAYFTLPFNMRKRDVVPIGAEDARPGERRSVHLDDFPRGRDIAYKLADDSIYSQIGQNINATTKDILHFLGLFTHSFMGLEDPRNYTSDGHFNFQGHLALANALLHRLVIKKRDGTILYGKDLTITESMYRELKRRKEQEQQQTAQTT